MTRLSFNKNKFYLKQLTLLKKGSSRTPIFHKKTSLRLTTLTLSSWMLEYGTRDHPVDLNLMLTRSLGHKYSGLDFATSLLSMQKYMGELDLKLQIHYIEPQPLDGITGKILICYQQTRPNDNITHIC